MSAGRNKDEYNAYMRDYIRKRYHRRRALAIIFLGGKCVKCGSVENLEFDHIDRTTKVATIGKIWTYNDDRFLSEVRKCQLLCHTCHEEKSLIDLGFKRARGTHGTVSSYRYCKCRLCKDAQNAYVREWKKRKKDKKRPVARRSSIVLLTHR